GARERRIRGGRAAEGPGGRGPLVRELRRGAVGVAAGRGELRRASYVHFERQGVERFDARANVEGTVHEEGSLARSELALERDVHVRGSRAQHVEVRAAAAGGRVVAAIRVQLDGVAFAERDAVDASGQRIAIGNIDGAAAVEAARAGDDVSNGVELHLV